MPDHVKMLGFADVLGLCRDYYTGPYSVFPGYIGLSMGCPEKDFQRFGCFEHQQTAGTRIWEGSWVDSGP